MATLPVLHPPTAPQRPHPLITHGDERTDPYYWLRDRENPAVLAYLDAENAYTESQMQHTEALQTQLYDEMLGRIQETDLSVPVYDKGYYYYSRTEEGQGYAIHCRKPETLDNPEEILLDENSLAEGLEFFDLGDFEVSLDHQLLAYSTDTNGSERYSLRIKNLETGELYPEAIADTGGVAWAKDNATLFYTKLDDTQRPYQVWRHQLGSDPSTDCLIFEEPDSAFYVNVGMTRSEAFLLLILDSKITSEVWILEADQPQGEFRCVEPRQKGLEYGIEHWGEQFYVVTNADGATNFKLMVAPVSQPSKANWQEVIPHREDVMLEDVDAYAHHLVISERRQGLPSLTIRDLRTDQDTPICFPEPTYSVGAMSGPDFNTNMLRFSYSSLVTPASVFDYNMDTEARELKKETPVLGGYDRSQYKSEWIFAEAADGKKIPISLVYRADLNPQGKNPLYLIGYGSYGYPYPAYFSSNRLSLLDRGIVCAIAHIRGGGEMGRRWYEDGKFLHKKNTFTDFIACAESLIQTGWTSSEHLVISGGSAGGLLMGAVLNLCPHLFKAAIAQVPFVDVLTTILDPDLPLSVMEWDEWGNPNDPEFYHYMKSYSPYDNVKPQDYPHLLITAGLNDPRVSYWEPAKWTAKLRTLKTDSHRLLLKTNMGAGHGGASGRYERLKEIAFEYAFLLDCLGISDP